MIASIQELLQKEAQAVLNIPVTDAYEKAVELIVEQVHRKKGKLVTSGMGKAGQIAMNIATTFCSTGIPSVFLHPSEAQHGDLGILQENMQKTGFTIEDYSKRHHGGYLGEKSRALCVK